jgi:ABC-type phosphate transport system substrate-binding protein
MKNRNSRLAVVALAALLALPVLPALAGPIVIAHPGVTETALSGGQVKDIFLGNSAQWSSGTRVVLCMLDDNEVSRAFLTSRVGKSHKQFATFWKKAVFSGTGAMPNDFASEAEMAAFVAKTVGAVGYIDETTPHDGVKVIAVN